MSGTYDESILTETKKALGIGEEVNTFDQDIRMHINSAFGTLNQLGIGPEGGFEIIDASQTWADFLTTDLRLSSVKSYVFLRTRLLFDPPAQSWHLVSLKEQIEQLEWRLYMVREDELPDDAELPTDTVVLDGGVI